jgi:hypothetical protein
MDARSDVDAFAAVFSNLRGVTVALTADADAVIVESVRFTTAVAVWVDTADTVAAIPAVLRAAGVTVVRHAIAAASNLRRANAAETAEEAAAAAASRLRHMAEANAVVAEEIVACSAMSISAKTTPFPVPVGNVAGLLYLAPKPGFHGYVAITE